MSRTAILLIAFGGPESLDDVGPFMTKLMGRPPAPQVVKRVMDRYRTIGGSSPLVRIVREQAIALQYALEHTLGNEGNLTVRYAFKYAEPSISSVVAQLASDGFTRVVGLSVSPHYSRISTGAYYDELSDVAKSTGMESAIIEGYYAQPAFLDAIAEKVRIASAKLDNQVGCNNPLLLFSAHSLPLQYIEEGDPYVDHIHATIAGVMQRLPGYRWRLAYQSRGIGQGQWLDPQVEETLEELAAQGHTRIVLVPISFTCDHIETLYDIDVVISNRANALGINFVRTEALNTSELFIEALAATVQPYIASAGQR